MTLTLTTITREDALDLMLRGAQTKRAGIEESTRDLRSQLNSDEAAVRKDIALAQADITRRYMEGEWQTAPPSPKRRKFSAAARKRMAEAQRARWAKVKT